jgi:hypothetical protein
LITYRINTLLKDDETMKALIAMSL